MFLPADCYEGEGSMTAEGKQCRHTALSYQITNGHSGVVIFGFMILLNLGAFG